MKLSRLLSLSLTIAGGLAAARVLKRRHHWEVSHNQVAICVDYDDVKSAAIRAGLDFDEMLKRLAAHGATHISLPELTINRLMEFGVLAPRAPSRPRKTPPPVGHWNYLHGPEELVAQLAAELATRLPQTKAQALSSGTLVFGGDLPAISEIGLGFDDEEAAQIVAQGLEIVPRPVSYAWPEKDLLERTLVHSARLGKLVAFAGNMILGHEMHLGETLTAMEKEDLTLVYFSESRHQKGDWFVAKRRLPNVILAHRFTAEEMIPLDGHAAYHVWAYLARERGIRFCYVNFFRVLHATKPLEGLHYVHHIRHALEHEGFEVTAKAKVPTPIPAPDKIDLALTGLAAGGITAAAASSILDLPEPVALTVTSAVTAAAVALPFLERPRGHLEEHYPPSYAPKALALATAAFAPVVANGFSARDRDSIANWSSALITQAAAAATLAGLTSGPDYHLRIEEFRGLGLDWLLPFLTAAAHIPNRAMRLGVQTTLCGVWYATGRRKLDVLSQFDPAHAEGHTHHLSTAQRIVGDARIRFGPQPARKWAGLAGVGSALAVVFARRGQDELAAGAALAGAAGATMGLVGFRRSERALRVTSREALPSFAIGAALGFLILLAGSARE